MHPQIVLREIAAAAAHLVNLRVRLLPPSTRVTQRSRAPIPLRFDLVPMVRTFSQLFFSFRIAAQQLWKIVDGIHHYVEVAVVIKIAKRAPARSHRNGNPRPGVHARHLRIGRCADSCTAICAAAYPASVAIAPPPDTHGHCRSRMSAQPSLSKSKNPQPQPRYCVCLPRPAMKCRVFKRCIPDVVVQRWRIAGKIRFHNVQVAVQIVIDAETPIPACGFPSALSAQPASMATSINFPFFMIFDTARSRSNRWPHKYQASHRCQSPPSARLSRRFRWPPGSRSTPKHR